MDIITLIETIETRINSYWNFYIIVIFANAGWVFSNFGSIRIETALLLIAGLVLFFISNLSFQKAALVHLSSAREELKTLKGSHGYTRLFEKYSEEMIPFRYTGSFVLHIVIDALLITMILLAVK